MLIKPLNQANFKQVQDDGAKKARMAVLIGPEEGAPNFVMRRIELEAGGCTPYHQHAWEHEVYILAGSGKLIGADGDFTLKPNISVFVKPEAKHQFAADSDAPLIFLCTIPKLNR